MENREEKFLQQLLATFTVEAQEHVSAISSGLTELERSPPEARRKEIVEGVFREAHSLKGAARSVNRTEVEAVCQSTEGLLAALKRGEVSFSPGVLDLLFQGVDAVNRLLVAGKEQIPGERAAVMDLRERLASAARGEEIPAPGASSQPRPPEPEEQEAVSLPIPSSTAGGSTPHVAETIRIPKHKLDSLLLEVEELVAVKLIARQHLCDLRGVLGQVERWAEEWARVRPLLRKTSPPRDGEGEERSEGAGAASAVRDLLERQHPASKAISGRLALLKKSFDGDSRAIGRMVDSLLEDLKDVLMFPCSSLLDIFPRIVRDLSKERGKEIDFRVNGGEIEIDNRILQELKDPLVHIVRNCVDHGIEAPKDRIGRGKPSRGKVTISVSRTDSGKVEILVSDDGSGIDPERIKSSAVSKGIVTNEEASRMGEEDAIFLVFRSGFSTAPAVTTLSGRGLGLAIVLEKIGNLGGTVAVESRKDSGTAFRIHIPLTLATFRGTLVRVGERIFAVPTTNVERVVGVRRESVKTVENLETVNLDGKAISLVRLGTVLELADDRSVEDADPFPALVLGSGGTRIAFQVDEVLNEQEILVKKLGKSLPRVRNVAGATVLGAGTVVPVLNVSDLLKSAARSAGTTRQVSGVTSKKGKKRKKILVVEDSITSRTLLKGILESAGYGVVTTVNGVDGFTALRSQPFDLVVSDVQMPRMNGLELTEKIRATKELRDLPVILVTGLESQEDKRKGVSAGANAYIVKSGFDQADLLTTIRRMI